MLCKNETLFSLTKTGTRAHVALLCILYFSFYVSVNSNKQEKSWTRAGRLCNLRTYVHIYLYIFTRHQQHNNRKYTKEVKKDHNKLVIVAGDEDMDIDEDTYTNNNKKTRIYLSMIDFPRKKVFQTSGMKNYVVRFVGDTIEKSNVRMYVLYYMWSRLTIPHNWQPR